MRKKITIAWINLKRATEITMMEAMMMRRNNLLKVLTIADDE
jgi:hypothetical protein